MIVKNIDYLTEKWIDNNVNIYNQILNTYEP